MARKNGRSLTEAMDIISEIENYRQEGNDPLVVKFSDLSEDALKPQFQRVLNIQDEFEDPEEFLGDDEDEAPEFTKAIVPQVTSISIREQGEDSLRISVKEAMTLPISTIRPNPDQARRIIRFEDMEELVESIAKSGLLQPIVVRPLEYRELGYSYEIVAGYRRFQACCRLGWTDIPVYVKETDNMGATALGIIENMVRADIHPIEETFAIMNILSKASGIQQDELKRILLRLHDEQSEPNKNKVIANDPLGQLILRLFDALPISLHTFVRCRLRILDSSRCVLEAILNNEIPLSSGLSIETGLGTDEQKQRLLAEAIEQNYSATQVKKRIKEIHREFESSSADILKDDFLHATKQAVSRAVWSPNDVTYIRELEDLIARIDRFTEKHLDRKTQKDNKRKKKVKATEGGGDQ